jgi:hypothetical protein
VLFLKGLPANSVPQSERKRLYNLFSLPANKLEELDTAKGKTLLSMAVFLGEDKADR